MKLTNITRFADNLCADLEDIFPHQFRRRTYKCIDDYGQPCICPDAIEVVTTSGICYMILPLGDRVVVRKDGKTLGNLFFKNYISNASMKMKLALIVRKWK